MSHLWILWRRELAAYFFSPIAYVTAIFFLVVMGFSFWMLSSILVQGEAGNAVMQELFGSIFFWLALLIIVPLLTMRLVAEERRSGTLETLLTAPVTEAEIIGAKFAGALAFFVCIWAPTIAYAYLLRHFSDAAAPVDLGPMAAGYLGALLVGAFYLAVGLLCSVLTRNQIVSAMICFAIIGLEFFAGFIPFITHRDQVRAISSYFSAPSHMLDFARGIVDTRPVLFYTSSTLLVLFMAVKALEARRLR